MTDSQCVDYLENICRMFVNGSKNCTGQALEYQQKYISAIRYAIAKLQSSEVSKMIEITKEEISEKMFFINDEGLDQPIAVIKVADLMNLDKANMTKMEVSKMKDKIKKAVADEFKYRAGEGRTNYSMEEVIYIVNEVIDEVFWENGDISQEQLGKEPKF